MTCIATSCCTQQNACVNDSNMSVVDDAGSMFPACDVYLACVYPELAQLLQTNDAGPGGNVATAEVDCSGVDGGLFPASSETAGNALLTCIVTSCLSCVP